MGGWNLFQVSINSALLLFSASYTWIHRPATPGFLLPWQTQHPSPLSDPILSSLTPKQPLERLFFLLPWYLRDKLRRSLKNLRITSSPMEMFSGWSLVFGTHCSAESCSSETPAGVRSSWSSWSWSLSSEVRGCSRSSSNNLDRLWKKGRVEGGREEKEGVWGTLIISI